VTEDFTMCPGVDIKIYNGHTVGQLVTYLHTGEKTFVYVGDVIPSAANIPLAWVSAYDTYPITSMTEKKKLLDEAIVNNQILIFEHDAYTECCFISESNGKYKMGEAGGLYEML